MEQSCPGGNMISLFSVPGVSVHNCNLVLKKTARTLHSTCWHHTIMSCRAHSTCRYCSLVLPVAQQQLSQAQYITQYLVALYYSCPVQYTVPGRHWALFSPDAEPGPVHYTITGGTIQFLSRTLHSTWRQCSLAYTAILDNSEVNGNSKSQFCQITGSEI